MALRGIASNSQNATNASIVVTLTANISGINLTNPMVVTVSTAQFCNPFGIGSLLTFAGITGTVELNGVTAAVTAIAGASGAWTVTLGAIDGTSGFSAWVSGGTATIVPVSGDTVLIMAGVNDTVPLAATFPGGFARPPGFTELQPNNGGGAGVWDFQWKTSAGGETSYTISRTTGRRWSAMVAIFSGRDQTNPFVFNPAQTSPKAPVTRPVTTSITGVISGAGDDLALFIPTGGDLGSVTYSFTSVPAGFGKSNTVFSGINFSPVGFCTLDENVAGGSSGTLAPVITCSSNETIGYGGWLVSLSPAGASAGMGGAFLLKA